MNNQPNNLQEYRNRYTNELTRELTKKPPKIPRDAYPHMEIFERHQILYLDIVVFPEDRQEFRYLLVAIDGCTRNVDFEELKFKDAPTTLRAFRNILRRRFITLPYQFCLTDNGGEFKGVFNQFLERNHIIHRYEKLARHSQLSIVNNMIHTLSAQINIRMANDEINNVGNINKEWRRGLGELRRILNRPEYLHQPPEEPNLNNPVQFKINPNTRILNIGDRVRVRLDHPVNAQGDFLYGGFRQGDLRWSPEIYTIENIILNAGQPVLYKLNGIGNRALYNEKQLMLVRN